MTKVSIITSVLNSQATIEDCILSIANQKYNNIEHIVIDGQSSDNTLSILKRHQGKIAVTISEPDNGIYDAMNKGITYATGDIVAMLNADDFYASVDAVSMMVDFIQSRQLDAAYGNLLYVNGEYISKEVRFWLAGDYKPGAFCKGWVPPHPTFFCRREIYKKHGSFRDDMKIAADFELMLRFIEKHQIKVGYLPQTIVKMRTGGKAYSWKGRIAGNLEILEAFKVNNLKPSPLIFIHKPIAKIAQILKRSEVNSIFMGRPNI